MPVLPNPRHERFCEELAKGKSASEAYETAGFKPNRHNGATLARQKHILTRVAELLAQRSEMEREATQKATEALAIDKQWVMARLVENAQEARALENFNASTRALELIGKEFGMFIDRKHIDVKNDTRVLTDEELLAIASALEGESGSGDFDEEGDTPLVH